MASTGQRVRRWLLWFCILAGAAALMLTVRVRLDKAHVVLAFLLVVLGGSAAEGRMLGLSLAGTAFLVFNWFFLRPYNTLVIANPIDWVVLIAFLITGVVAAQLLERQRREAENSRQRADEIDRLATLGAETLNAPRVEDALDAIATVISEAMKTDRCEIFQWSAHTGLQGVGRSPEAARPAQDSALLSYVVTHAQPAAERADHTLTLLGDALAVAGSEAPSRPALLDLRALGIPLSVRGRVVGGLRLSSSQPFGVTDDQRRVLSALSYYAALGVERLRLTGAAEEAESLRRADRLKDALLAAVSHDLRTPLTAIKGIANEVWRGGDSLRAMAIEEEADRLNELVDDLLQLSQINAGVLPITVAFNTADDVVAAALERVEEVHGRGRIEVRIAHEGEILVGAFDFTHTIRALTNILENALKYSDPAAPVVLDVRQVNDRIRIAVEDSGPGIKPEERSRIFEPFYRGSNIPEGTRGTGLGLAIARQLIDAQHGSLTYEPGMNGGSSFVIELPAAALPAI